MPLRLNKLPIRLRVTLAFAAVLALLLGATGLFLYVRMGAALDDTVHQGLLQRAGDLRTLVRQADSGLAESGRSPLGEQGEGLAQILEPDGRVLDSPPALGARPLLSSTEAGAAARGTLTVDKPSAAGTDDRVRLLATPVRAQGRRLIVVVGSSLSNRDDALRKLGGLLLVGGPITLLLASLAGYGAASAALRPVERMRRRAAEIQGHEPGPRLPVGDTEDEIARLGTTLNTMLSRLEDALARERTFVADASHELRTPLAVLKAEIDLALRRARSPAELESALGSASEETDRLVALAEDLLVIARSDQGRLNVGLEPLDAGELVESVRRRFARRARERGVELAVEAPGGLTVDADRLRLEQALGNLADNALGHGARHVTLRAVEAGDVVELHVLDDGDGFPPAFIDSAFERFTRADGARGRGNAGLGLAIVAAVADAHDGRAGAANRPGGGADVWLSVPRHAS